MINKAYRKGRRKEYAVCDKLKAEGFDIVQRTAGSHSVVDVFAVDSKNKIIKLIQCKRVLSKTMGEVDQNLKEKIEGKLNNLNGIYNVEVVVV